jgi:type II secretory pathway component PulJ
MRLNERGWTLLELLTALGCLCLIALVGIVILIIAYKTVKG